VTPVGFAPAFLVIGFLLIAGAVSTCEKTRGLELPVADRVPSRAIATGFSNEPGPEVRSAMRHRLVKNDGEKGRQAQAEYAHEAWQRRRATAAEVLAPRGDSYATGAVARAENVALQSLPV
jgi:hypothetical protein